MEKTACSCMNWKVIAGLTGVGLGIWLVAPNLLPTVLPVLLVAVCPISMILMTRSVRGEPDSHRRETSLGCVAPSPGVRLAELRATREAIDREIRALAPESLQIQTTARRPVADGAGRRI